MTMFNSIYYKCVLAQKLTGNKAKRAVGYGFTKSVIGNIFRVTVSEEEELERGRRTEIERADRQLYFDICLQMCS